MYKYYYLYQITNLINGKIYIGIHRTDNLDDGYMGSGVALKSAKEKYGLENFEKEILEFFDSEDDMFAREIELVDADFVLRGDTYNLTEGGFGGSYLACSKGGKIGGSIVGKTTGPITGKTQGKLNVELKRGCFSKEGQKRLRQYLISEEHLIRLLNQANMIKDSEEIQKQRKETYKKIKHQQGKTNSQYGTMWVTNGADSKKIGKEEQIPSGWKKGRVQKKL